MQKISKNIGLETNFKNTRPRPPAQGRDRDKTETAKN